MASLKPITRDNADEHTRSLLDLATQSLQKLQNRDQISANLASKLEESTKTQFPLPASTARVRACSELDTLGVGLWNSATNIVQQEESPVAESHTQSSDIVALLRIFAYLLLDGAHSALSQRRNDFDQRIRIFKVGLKAAKICLNRHRLDFALQALENCANYVALIEEAHVPISDCSKHDGLGDVTREVEKQLICEYYLLRMALAWKSARLDLAQHFQSKVSRSTLSHSVELSLKAADMYFEAGRSCQQEASLIWMERTIQSLDVCTGSELCQEAQELRLAAASVIVNAFLKQRSSTLRTRAWDLTAQLDSLGFGNRISLQLMQLEILLADQVMDASEMKRVLIQIVHSMILTEKTLQALMHAVHRVKCCNVQLSCQILELLITERLLPDLDLAVQDDAIVIELEKAIVTYTLFSMAILGGLDGSVAVSLQSLFDVVYKVTCQAMSAKTVHAVQALLWRKTGTSEPGVAEQWCQLFQHPLLESASAASKARICRKVIMIALERSDCTSARVAFNQLPQSTQDDCTSRYLAYKLALRSSDDGLARECLDVIIRQSDDDQNFLYACAIEAQHSNCRLMVIAALRAILDRSVVGNHSLALLRCIVRLLIGQLDDLHLPLDDVIGEILDTFEILTDTFLKSKIDNGAESQAEVQWWTKNAYNLALRLCADLRPEFLVRLLKVCLLLLDVYQIDANVHHEDILRKRFLCHFLHASALVLLGRLQVPYDDEKRQFYSEARQQIHACMAIWNQRDRQSAAFTELQTHIFELLKFDLEAASKLQEWDQLVAAFDACLALCRADQWDTLADLAIAIYREASDLEVSPDLLIRIPMLLQRVVNEIYKEDRSVAKVARWLRVTLSLATGTKNLSTSSNNGESLSMKLLHQAANMARRGYENATVRYPEDELQWLAATAFNHGVDALAVGEEGFTSWAEAALGLARWADDNGSLHANLTCKRRQAEERMLTGRQL